MIYLIDKWIKIWINISNFYSIIAIWGYFTVNNISFRLFYFDLMMKIGCTKIRFVWIMISFYINVWMFRNVFL